MSMGNRGVGLFLFLAGLLPGCSTTVWPREGLVPEAPRIPFSYDDLDAVLERFVDEDGRVDYAGLVAEPEALERFYGQAAALSPENHPEAFADPVEELAYWINVYNAGALRLVVHYYPLGSVKDVSSPAAHFYIPPPAGFFAFTKLYLGGRSISLYRLENRVIRERYTEPRIHFALNCASLGCPVLPRRAFRPETLDEELTREARLFFAAERNLRIDHEAKVVHLSEIMDWYESDFTDWLADKHPDRPATLIEYAALYATEDAAAELRGRAAEYALEFTPYDWTLNDQALTRP